MPDFAVHYAFGQEVRGALAPETADRLREAQLISGRSFCPLWRHLQNSCRRLPAPAQYGGFSLCCRMADCGGPPFFPRATLSGSSSLPVRLSF